MDVRLRQIYIQLRVCLRVRGRDEVPSPSMKTPSGVTESSRHMSETRCELLIDTANVHSFLDNNGNGTLRRCRRFGRR